VDKTRNDSPSVEDRERREDEVGGRSADSGLKGSSSFMKPVNDIKNNLF
jgi:hypothetical protein